MQETSVKGNKIKKFSNKITHDLETLGGIHKKTGHTVRDFITEELWKTF